MLILGFFLLSISMFLVKPNTLINNSYNAGFLLIIYILLITYKIANLSLDSTPDMYVYFNEYLEYSGISLVDALTISNKEFLFTTVQWILSNISTSFLFFKIVSWFLFISIFLLSLMRIFRSYQLLAVFIGFTTYFIFFSYALNTMRQGLAISLLFFAISILITDSNQKKLFYTAIICAPLIHFSSLFLSITLFVLRKFDLKLKTLLLIWITSLGLFITNINKSLFGNFQSDSMSTYSSEALLKVYTGGVNRIDFLLFGTFFLFIGLLVRKFMVKEHNFRVYDKLLKVYILFNTYYLMVGFVTYSDRIGSYSWFLIPLLVLFPIVKTKVYNPLRLVGILLLLIFIGIYNGSLKIIL